MLWALLSGIAERVAAIALVQWIGKKWSAWVGRKESLRSKHAYQETEIEFDNRLIEPVDIYWITYKGGRKNYGTLPSMQQKRLMTFVSHPWIIEKVSDGKEVLRIIADGSIGRVIIEDG